MDKLIDIIIPAYNAHDTIARTLFSICLQDIVDNIKVYIIDDCSNKSYDYLIDDFKDRLDLTIYRLDKNSGPGVCRNKGLDISNNEFVMFIDADDMFINNKSISVIYNNMDGYDLGVGLVEFDHLVERAMIGMTDKTVTYFQNHNRCLHGKMYRRSYIDKYGIRFNNTYRHEDSSFHEVILMSKPRVFISSNPTYFYSFNEKSLTHDKNGIDEFNTYKDYIDNTMYAIDKGLDNNFDINVITDIAIASIVYLYFEYHNYYESDYKDNLIEWIKPLVKFYKEHKDILTKDRIDELYNMFKYNYIGDIKISFDDFINKIGE